MMSVSRALANGENPELRIALCGDDTEHEDALELDPGVEWKANGGFAIQSSSRTRGQENANRERIWLSPHCLNQPGLFDAAESATLNSRA